MRLDHPTPAQIPALRALWTDAFGDTEAYLDSFFTLGFSPDRCRCVTVDGELAAALYWFDMTCRAQSVAYLYAVATKPDFRGRGLCRALMADTHQILKERGYAGAILSPENEGLARMYGTMGYSHCASISEWVCEAGEPMADLRKVDAEGYNARRNELLPTGGVRLEETALAFLAAHGEFYVGKDFVLAASRSEDGSLFCPELLGDASAAPGILTALGCRRGTFRAPGSQRPFAMFRPLQDWAKAPQYLGIAFD